MTTFTYNVISIIKNIPFGKVSSYKYIAESAGNKRAARQVARILHSCSSKYSLPWYRVINSKGEISLNDFGGEMQKILLEKEGILVTGKKIVDLERHLIKTFIIDNEDVEIEWDI